MAERSAAGLRRRASRPSRSAKRCSRLPGAARLLSLDLPLLVSVLHLRVLQAADSPPLLAQTVRTLSFGRVQNCFFSVIFRDLHGRQSGVGLQTVRGSDGRQSGSDLQTVRPHLKLVVFTRFFMCSFPLVLVCSAVLFVITGGIQPPVGL